MRKFSLVAMVALLAATSAIAAPLHVGLSAYGGVGIPVVNDLSSTGSQFGIRTPISVIPFLTVEPFFLHAGLGDASADVGGIAYTRDGGNLGGYGVNLLIASATSPMRIYPYAGVGAYTLKRANAEDVRETGFEGGLGFGMTLPVGIGFDLRAGLLAVVTGPTSLKYANVTGGLTYRLPLPSGGGR